MTDSFDDRLDRFERAHPRLMLAATILLGVVTTLVMVYSTNDTAIVYRAF